MTHHELVALVVDASFGSRVVKLSECAHVWLIDSQQNREVCDDLAATNGPEPYSKERGITIFSATSGEAASKSATRLVETVIDHHPEISSLRVYGSELTEELRSELRNFGFVNVAKKSDYIDCRLARM